MVTSSFLCGCVNDIGLGAYFIAISEYVLSEVIKENVRRFCTSCSTQIKGLTVMFFDIHSYIYVMWRELCGWGSGCVLSVLVPNEGNSGI